MPIYRDNCSFKIKALIVFIIFFKVQSSDTVVIKKIKKNCSYKNKQQQNLISEKKKMISYFHVWFIKDYKFIY